MKGKSQGGIAAENYAIIVGNGFAPQAWHVEKLLKEGYLKSCAKVTTIEGHWKTEAEGKDKASAAAAMAAKQRGYSMETLMKMKWELERLKFQSGEEFFVVRLIAT